MRQLNYNEQSKRVKERRVVKAPTEEQQDEGNGDAATVKSKHSYFQAELLVLTSIGNPKGPNGSGQHQPRPPPHHHANYIALHLRLILTMEPTDVLLVLRRSEAQRRATIRRRN